MAKSASNSGKGRTSRKAGNGSTAPDNMTDFERRLSQARSKLAGKTGDDGKARGSALGTAFRITTELVAGLVVGGFIGWQLDKWLDTSPVFLLVFFVLGAGAGILNVVRTAWNMQSGAKGSGDGN